MARHFRAGGGGGGGGTPIPVEIKLHAQLIVFWSLALIFALGLLRAKGI